MFSDRKALSRSTRRKRLEWPEDRLFKILSIDGGGIRGLYASSILERIENEFGAPSDYFDLISGTSTGGIIGIGLGLGIPSHKINEIYRVDGKEIFPAPKFSFLRKIRQLFRPIHDHAVLEEKLKNNFGDEKFGSSKARLVVPAFVGPSPQIAVFKTDHHPDYRRDWECEAWKVARSTSAAPTYYEGHGDGNDSYFLDGGVWANNPILCALIEAMTSYDLSLSQIRVLSIGTGSKLGDLEVGMIRKGFIGWREIISVAMGLTSDAALGQSRLLLGPENILRLDPHIETPIDLDDWAAAMKTLPPLAAQDFEANKAQIGEFFSVGVEPRERFYSAS